MRWLGQCSDPPRVALIHGRQRRARLGHAKATGELACGQLTGQLEQPQRIPVGLRDDPVANLLVELTRHRGRYQRSRVFLGQPLDRQARQRGEQLLVAHFPHRAQQDNRLSQKPPAHEAQDLPRRLVEPLSIVDQTDQRAFRGRLREQPEHGEADHKSIRSRAGRDSESNAQRLLLRLRQHFDPAEQRLAKLVQSRKRHLQLGLNAGDLGDAAARGLPRAVLQQRRLSDARFAAQHQDGALPLTSAAQHQIERGALTLTTPERRHPSYHQARNNMPLQRGFGPTARPVVTTGAKRSPRQQGFTSWRSHRAG